MPQHLVSAADGQHRNPIFNCSLQFGCFSAIEILQQDFLLKILTAANEDEVILGSIQHFSDRHTFGHDVDAAPVQALFHTENIATVTIEVQNIRVEVTDL